MVRLVCPGKVDKAKSRRKLAGRKPGRKGKNYSAVGFFALAGRTTRCWQNGLGWKVTYRGGVGLVDHHDVLDVGGGLAGRHCCGVVVVVGGKKEKRSQKNPRDLKE